MLATFSLNSTIHSDRASYSGCREHTMAMAERVDWWESSSG